MTAPLFLPLPPVNILEIPDYLRRLNMAIRELYASAGTSAHAASHQHGGADEVATATAAANAIPKAGAGGVLADEWIPARAPDDAYYLLFSGPPAELPNATHVTFSDGFLVAATTGHSDFEIDPGFVAQWSWLCGGL